MSDNDNRFEMKCGVMLAIFASILAILELGGAYSEYGMSIAYSEKVNAYAWYNSKSIKQNLVEGQRDSLASLLDAGVISTEHSEATHKIVEDLNEKINRYEKEKHEITVGSANLQKEEWIQDVDGVFGKVIGAQEWEQESEDYGAVTEIFDLANVFLQICLVVGAISLIVRTPGSRKAFFNGAVALGLLGTFIGVRAFIQYIGVAYD